MLPRRRLFNCEVMDSRVSEAMLTSGVKNDFNPKELLGEPNERLPETDI